MNESSTVTLGRTNGGTTGGVVGSVGVHDVLTDILRAGAVDLLAAAVQAEVAAWIDSRAAVLDEQGRRQVVRNGVMPERVIVTGIGPVAVRQPRVHDRRPAAEGREKFSSAILPPYLRKTRSMEDLIPWLYLKGVSTGDFSEALAALIGVNTPGFSATTVTRLKESWERDYTAWNARDLTGKNYVYLWVDGIHFNIRLGEQDRQCILVIMGATADGKKELIAVADGFRESEQCWKELLLDVKSRGHTIDPKMAIGDGALGFWKALPQVFPATKRAALLDAQDGQCAEQTPQTLAGQREGPAASGLDGGHQGRGGEVVRPVRGDLHAQVPRRGRVPVERPGRAARVLRLPRRALAAHPDDQRHRERLRDGATADGEDQRERQPHGLPDDGVQADGKCLEDVAEPERIGAYQGGHRRRRLCGRRQRSDIPESRRVISRASTTFDNTSSSRASACCSKSRAA